MDKMVAHLNGRFSLFADYVERFPNLVPLVEDDMAVLVVASDPLNDGFLPVDVLVLARDAAYRLVGLADQGGFCDLSELFYREYERISSMIAL